MSKTVKSEKKTEMSAKEATEMVRDDMRLHHDFLSGKYRHALNMAIKALEKEEPLPITDIHVDEFYCPACGAELSTSDELIAEDQYCRRCGQKLKGNAKEKGSVIC